MAVVLTVRDVAARKGIPEDDIPGIFSAAAVLARDMGGGPEAMLLVEKVLEDIQIERARKDPAEFIAYAARDRTGGKFKMAPFHRDIQHFIPRQEDTEEQWQGIIELPRDHGKTNQVMYRIIWEIGHDPTIRIKIITAGGASQKALYGKIVTSLQDIILNNPCVRKVFPDLLPGAVWSSGAFTVQGAAVGEKEYTVEGASIMGAGAGGRADLLIFDDVCDFGNSVRQPAMREQVKHTYGSTWVNLLHPPGRIIYLCTPWHMEDLSCHLLENPDYDRIVRPAINQLGEPLWPEEWPLKRLEIRRRTIGDREFNCQFLLQPYYADEMVFGNEALCAALCPDYSLTDHAYKKLVDPMPKFIGVDLGYARGGTSAFTVIVTVALGRDGRLYLVDIWRGRCRRKQIVEKVLKKYEQFRPAMTFVEDNGLQRSVVEDIDDENLYIPIKGCTTSGVNKNSEEIGVPGMAVAMEKGKWVIPCRHLIPRLDISRPVESISSFLEPDLQADDVANLIYELKNYPMGKYRDIVMAMWFASQASGSMGVEPVRGAFMFA